jgi:ABC-2 type transport system permease protein
MRDHWRTLRWAAWLGWQIDGNWASPPVFAFYVLIRPLTGSLLLVCMYFAVQAATGGQATPGYLPFLYISSACFMVVGGVTFGMSAAVVTDRESYGMLKFIRISPAGLRSYLIGRGLARAAQAALGAVPTVGLGLLLFADVRQAMGNHGIAWGWLTVYLLIGSAMMLALGLLLAATVMNMARHGMYLSEGVAGVLYLLSGAVFPIDILPPWLRCCSLILPPTYWLEGMRRALLGPSHLPSPLNDLGNGQLALILMCTTLALGGLAYWLFHWSERRAWYLGRFDQTTGI